MSNPIDNHLKSRARLEQLHDQAADVTLHTKVLDRSLWLENPKLRDSLAEKRATAFVQEVQTINAARHLTRKSALKEKLEAEHFGYNQELAQEGMLIYYDRK